MFLPTCSTVDRPSFRGLEWYFAFFSTVRTNGFSHCSWPVKVSITHFLHFFFFINHTSALNKQCTSVKIHNSYLNIYLFFFELYKTQVRVKGEKLGQSTGMKSFKSVHDDGRT